ncbi:MAG TPA: lytic murein transglycosylase [Beijerinckiaceae bacterium]
MRIILLAAVIGAALTAPALAQGSLAAPAPPAKAPRSEATDTAAKEASSPEFARYLESLWLKAEARAISRATFDLAFKNLIPDPKIAAVTRAQSEFVTPIWAYLDGAVSAARLKRGAEAARQWGETLDAIEAATGVPKAVVLGAWGMESNFGGFTGKTPVIRALATLAFARHRAGYFERELIAALEMIEKDHVRPAEMLGSWAGAMGQTQFMPSSFLAYAADGDGDGKRDIWTSVPDVLASIANFLKEHGWKPGLPWGFEVALPEGFDYAVHRRGFAEWAAAGVRRMDGAEMPRSGEGLLFLPAGARGPAFLLSENFFVIKAYNTSDSYALAVGHLGDRILGGPPVQGAWPRAEPMLGRDERVELQKRLAERGLLDGDADGRIGFKTRDAVRRFQLDRGLVPDGHADPGVLAALRAAR